jgi:PPM family protein phosphatase
MNDVRPAYQRLKIGEATHPGNTGKNNEDSYGYIVSPVRDNKSGQLLIAVVADGIGGEIAGEEAAQLAVKTIKDSMIVNASTEDLPQALTKAVQNANAAVYKRSQEREIFAHMGTTAAVIAVSDNQLYVANVGDSRIYLIRRGSITQLSTDHSWAQEALDAGRISPAEARKHPNRNVLMRYLGVSRREIDVDLRIRAVGRAPAQHHTYIGSPLILEPDDALVLCTDGLTDLVSDGEICTAVVRNPAQQAADRLVEVARRRGGPDNITVLVLKSRDVAVATWTPRRSLMFGAAVLLLFSTIALAAHTRLAAQPSTEELAPIGAASEPVPISTPAATHAEPLPKIASADVDPAIPAAAALPMASQMPLLTSIDKPVASRTPLPTSTAVPTWTPVPTSTPTSTPTLTPHPVASAAPMDPADPAGPLADLQLPKVELLGPEPDAHADTKQAVKFSWLSSAPLPKGTACELVWWGSSEDADTAARGIAPPLTDNSLTVNLDAALGGRTDIFWAVLLVNVDPYTRLTRPSQVEKRALHYKSCTVHQKCDTCQESYRDNTGQKKTRNVPCNCRDVCD